MLTLHKVYYYYFTQNTHFFKLHFMPPEKPNEAFSLKNGEGDRP